MNDSIKKTFEYWMKYENESEEYELKIIQWAQVTYHVEIK